MSRCFKMLLVLFLLAGLPAATAAAASAADTTAAGRGETQYRLDALDVTVGVPEDFTVLTRGFDPEDPNIARLGLDGKALGDSFISKSIYLDGVSADKVSELLVFMPESSSSKSYPDFRVYSDSALRRNSGDLVTELRSQGVGDISVDVYGNAQAKYLKLDFRLMETAVSIYREMYCTVIDGKLLIFALDCFGQPPAETQKDSLKQIVDGLVFGKKATGVISGSLSHGLYIFGINLCGVVLTGMVGIAAVGLLCLIFGRRRADDRTPAVPPLAPSGQTFTPPPRKEPPSAPSDRPAPKQLTCPNCFASNWDSSTRCAICGAKLERDTCGAGKE